MSFPRFDGAVPSSGREGRAVAGRYKNRRLFGFAGISV